jgi:hypothetical protein
MQRTLLSVAVAGCVAASLSAQCVAPSGPQTIQTPFVTSTHYFGTPTMDPGPANACDLTVDAPISITSVAVNLLNDGTLALPNLVGAPNGTLEFWAAASDTVMNPALLGTYTHVPPVGPPAGWVHMNPGETGNLVFAAPDQPSIGTFASPINLGVGTYAIMCVMVPSGPVIATDRIHPLITATTISPVPLTYDDGFVKIQNGQARTAAFSVANLGPTSPAPGPWVPCIQFNYNITVGSLAHQTSYGEGCYDRKFTFYESYSGPIVPNVAQPDVSTGGLNGFNMLFLGDRYLVQNNAVAGLSQPFNNSTGAGFPLHPNVNPPGQTSTGGTNPWDDATTGTITLPFAFNYPGGPGGGTTQIDISSNGIIYLGTTNTRTFGFYDDHAAFCAGEAAIAPAWCDWEPADLNTFTGGTGDIWVDSDGSTYVAITFAGVQEWNVASNISTMQVVLYNGGNVEVRYSGCNHSDAPLLIGFTPGHGSPDPGSGATPRQAPDISSAAGGGGYLSGDGAHPAEIKCQLRPRVGNNLILDVTNADVTTAANITVISTASLLPPTGFPLAGIGMPGCSAHVVLPEILSLFSFGAGPFSWNVGLIQPAFAGVSLYAQAVQLTVAAPPFNSLNWLVSDAVCFHMNVN